MAYNPRYFVDNYFPLYFQTSRKTEPLDRWIECGWIEQDPQWVDGRPCDPPVTPTQETIGGSTGEGPTPREKQRRRIQEDDDEIINVIMQSFLYIQSHQ
jgi:hypothetical protein